MSDAHYNSGMDRLKMIVCAINITNADIDAGIPACAATDVICALMVELAMALVNDYRWYG